MDIEREIEDGTNNVWTGSLTQLYGLISHIDGVTSRYVGKQDSQSAQAVKYLADSFIEFARAYHRAFNERLAADSTITEQERPYQLHKAIRRLSSDWEQLHRILAAVTDPRIDVLEVLVRAAQPSTSWATDYIENAAERAGLERVLRQASRPKQFMTVPYFGRHFELVSFQYAPQIFVTGVPLYNLEAPWDWHVVWHEMAGHVVNLLEEKNVIKDQLLTDLEALDFWQVWSDLYDRSTAGAPLPQKKESDESEPDHAEHDHITWDMIEPADWVAEIVEDAYGLLSLGPSMYVSLQRVLRQNYGDDYMLYDTRHPPLRLRLDMAGSILLTRLPAEKHDSMLRLLEFDDEQTAACQRLKPMAQVIAKGLIGPTRNASYIRQPYDLLDTEMAETLKQQLLDGQPLLPGATIPALITAANLAFSQQPNAGVRISRSVKKAVTDLPADEVDQVQLVVGTESDFQALLGGYTWQELLERSFSTLDAFQPEEHTHPDKNPVPLKWFSHGREHRLSHTSKQHYPK